MNEEKDKSWSEEELQSLIGQSAEELTVPASLLPEQVVERLKAKQKGAKALQKGASAQKDQKRRRILHITELAAAIALVIAIGGIGIRMRSAGTDSSTGAAMFEVADIAEMANESSMSGNETSSAAGETEDAYEMEIVDGSYLYRVQPDNTIAIFDTQSGQTSEKVAEIVIDAELADTIETMYVEGNDLYVTGTKIGADSDTDGESGSITVVLIYDVGERQNPKLARVEIIE